MGSIAPGALHLGVGESDWRSIGIPSIGANGQRVRRSAHKRLFEWRLYSIFGDSEDQHGWIVDLLYSRRALARKLDRLAAQRWLRQLGLEHADWWRERDWTSKLDG
jgi:hypothetical protein